MSNSPNHERGPLAVAADAVENTGYMLVLVAGAFARFATHHRPGRMFRRLVDQLYLHSVKSLLVVYSMTGWGTMSRSYSAVSSPKVTRFLASRR